MKAYDLIKQHGPSFLFIYLIILGTTDTVLRWMIQSNSDMSLILLYVNTLHYALFFGIILVVLGLVFSHKKTFVLIRDISRYFWILALNPLISYLIYGEVSKSLVTPEGVSLLLLVVILSAILIVKTFPKTDTFRSIIAFLGVIGFYLPVFMVNRISLINGARPHFDLYGLLSMDLFLRPEWTMGSLRYQQYHLLVVLFLLEIFVVYALFAYVSLGRTFKNLIRTIKPFRTLHFAMMTLLGVIFVRTISEVEALSISSINHLPFIILAALCPVLGWQFTTLLNDLYDLEIDDHVHPNRPLVSGRLEARHYIDMLVFTALLSLLISLLLGPPLVLLTCLGILFGVLYSVPPIRLRDRLYGHICVGLGSVIGFLFGVYSPYIWRDGIYLSSMRIERGIQFYPDVLQATIIILVVLSVSPLINALSDYEGDRRAGVRNVYTVFGLEKGKKIVSIFIVFLFVAPGVMFHTYWDITFMLITGVISSLLFYFLEDHRPVFGMYFTVLVYLLLRLIGHI